MPEKIGNLLDGRFKDNNRKREKLGLFQAVFDDKFGVEKCTVEIKNDRIVVGCKGASLAGQVRMESPTLLRSIQGIDPKVMRLSIVIKLG